VAANDTPDAAWVDGALRLDKLAIARLISVFEDRRPAAAPRRAAVLDALADKSSRSALFVGITGTPGAGKSTLVGALADALVAADQTCAVAVLAVDPSSHVSGGALLGDRTRVSFSAAEPRLYFRSQASDRDLGGVSRQTFQVCRLLSRLFDLVFVETVGIGQSETEIQHVADWTYLVLQPLGGDQVQFMKAGIMEVPDAFVLNKCDEVGAADRSYHTLRASLSLVRPGGEAPAILRTSARTGMGIDDLARDIAALPERVPAARRDMVAKERYFFSKWVRDEFGRFGLRRLRDLEAEPGDFLTRAGSFDDAQASFARLVASNPLTEVHS